jgi:hypothetical protein
MALAGRREVVALLLRSLAYLEELREAVMLLQAGAAAVGKLPHTWEKSEPGE